MTTNEDKWKEVLGDRLWASYEELQVLGEAPVTYLATRWHQQTAALIARKFVACGLVECNDSLVHWGSVLKVTGEIPGVPAVIPTVKFGSAYLLPHKGTV